MEHTGEDVYVHVAKQWDYALTRSEQALGALRAIYPAYCWHVRVETANNAIESAIGKLQSAVSELHRAGRHVLGAEQYEQFCEERSGNVLERGDT